MNKKLAFIPASLIIAGALALTGCGAGQTVDLEGSDAATPSASATGDYTALHEALQAAVDVAQAAADRIEKAAELQFRKSVEDSISSPVYFV